MLFKARPEKNADSLNSDIPEKNDGIFLNDTTENILADGWCLEKYVDNSSIEHVRVYREICDFFEPEEIWEIYTYDDEAMPLELLSIYEDQN